MMEGYVFGLNKYIDIIIIASALAITLSIIFKIFILWAIYTTAASLKKINQTLNKKLK